MAGARCHVLLRAERPGNHSIGALVHVQIARALEARSGIVCLTIGEDGCIRQNSLENYRVPLALDTVAVDIDLYEGAPSIGPLGVKGAGEVPIMNPPAAIACAVANATGLRIQQMPLTPPRVLGLLMGNESAVELPHIADNWWDNVLMNPAHR